MLRNVSTRPPKRLVLLVLLSWLSMLGLDFFLHAGLLASLYLRPSPFLLPPLTAFQLIPIGYFSILLVTILLFWLMSRLNIIGSRKGFVFGLKLSALAWGSFALGLFSISTADSGLLAGWFLGQSAELALGGAVIGRGLAGESLKRLSVQVTALIIVLVVVTVVLQTLGLAPAVRL